MEEPKPEVQKIEFEYKDKLVRSTIEKIDSDLSTVKEDVNEIKQSLEKMDERLYEISKQR
jgi:peptidoglycan hydrolase CwlO-like protein